MTSPVVVVFIHSIPTPTGRFALLGDFAWELTDMFVMALKLDNWVLMDCL